MIYFFNYDEEPTNPFAVDLGKIPYTKHHPLTLRTCIALCPHYALTIPHLHKGSDLKENMGTHIDGVLESKEIFFGFSHWRG